VHGKPIPVPKKESGLVLKRDQKRGAPKPAQEQDQKQHQKQSQKGSQQQKSEAFARPVIQAKRPQESAKEPSKKQTPQSQKAKASSATQQRPQPKRKRDEQEEKFQKIVNSYKQKLFKTSEQTGSMDRWMAE